MQNAKFQHAEALQNIKLFTKPNTELIKDLEKPILKLKSTITEADKLVKEERENLREEIKKKM